LQALHEQLSSVLLAVSRYQQKHEIMILGMTSLVTEVGKVRDRRDNL